MVWFIRRKFQFGNTARTVIFLQAAVIVYLCLYIFADKGEFSYRSTNSSLTPDETVVESGTRWSSAGDTASLPGTVTTAAPEPGHRTQARPAQSVDTTRYKDWRMVLPTSSKEDQLINSYLAAYETQCHNLWTVGRKLSTVQTPLCPCVSPRLRGKLYPNQKIAYRPWDEIVKEVGKDVQPGGIYKPPDCLARLRVALVIPYRDREVHLRQILRHLHPVLQNQLLEYRVFVVEQNLPVIFNKASMMNIGYLESIKLWPLQDCIVFHDVDMLMEDDRNLFYCGKKPHHMGVYTDKFKYKVLYFSMFGGVLSFTRDQFYQVNGYSNNYFGWGGEDDDMYNRVKAQKLNFTRPASQVARYVQLRHQRDGANPVNNDVAGAWKTRPDVYKVDGVRQIMYNVLEIKNMPLYTWIHVDLNVTNLNYSLKEHITLHNYTEDQDVTCKGGDLSNHRFSQITCQFSCDRKSNCAGYVYNPAKDSPCFLKYRICDSPEHEANATLFIRQKSTQKPLILKHKYDHIEGDCLGGDIGGYDLDYEGCSSRCDEDAACVAFQFAITHQNACWLKKVCKKIEAIAGLSLYIKGSRIESQAKQQSPNS